MPNHYNLEEHEIYHIAHCIKDGLKKINNWNQSILSFLGLININNMLLRFLMQAISSVVEHLQYMEGVEGSNPLIAYQ